MEYGGNGEVVFVMWVIGSYYVFGIEYLLGEFWDGEGFVLLVIMGGQRSEFWYEEVEMWEGYYVDG